MLMPYLICILRESEAASPNQLKLVQTSVRPVSLGYML